MPQKRTPTKVLEMRGSFKDHPDRKRKRAKEPKYTQPMPMRPPDHLLSREKKIWKELMDAMPQGVIEVYDQVVFETLVKLFARFRTTRAGITGAELSLMIRCASLLGMSPVDRSRVIVEPTTGGVEDWSDD